MWLLKLLVIIGLPVIAFVILRPFRFAKNAAGEAIVSKVFGGRVALVCLILALGIVISMGFGTVKEGFVGVVTTFDRATGTVKDPGLYWVTPIRDRVIATNTQITSETMKIAAATSTQQDVTMDVTVNYKVIPSMALDLYKEYRGGYVAEVLRPALEFWAKDASGHYAPAEMLQDRAALANEMRASLNDRSLAPQLIPFEIVAVNVSNLEFSSEYTDAIEAKQKAEQDALREENVLRQVQLQAQQQIENARAEAEKIRIQAEAITAQGGMEYVMLQMIQAWDGSFPNTLTQVSTEGGTGPFTLFDLSRLVNSGQQ